MTVDEYKSNKDNIKLYNKMEKLLSISENDMEESEIRRMKAELHSLKNENTNLKKEKVSPYVLFYYSSPEKQAYVIDEIRRRNIPIRETENGFEAKEFYTSVIREIEKSFKNVSSNYRETLKNDIDRLMMQSDSFNEFLSKLEKLGYEIKKGKYLAVRPFDSHNFIRLKSLGEKYSELALRNRMLEKQNFENDLDKKISEGESNNINIAVLRTMRFYTVAFKKDELSCRKIRKNEPFSWKNDEILDGLTRLNNKINDGATLDSIRYDFSESEKRYNKIENELKSSRNDLKFFLDLKEQAELLFEGKKSEKFSLNQARDTFSQHKNITQNNYKKIDELIQTEKENIKKYEENLSAEKIILKETSDTLAFAEKVFGGTYIQSLVNDERYRKASDFIPNGFWSA